MDNGEKPTLVRTTGSSYRDITAISDAWAYKCSSWEVLDEETMSDHRYISININTTEKKKGEMKPRNMGP